MSIKGIQGQLLELTVVGCSNLKDTELFSRQAPHVLLEYGSTKFRTRTCTDDDKNPIFQEKFVFTLIEGLREINVSVWNTNSLSSDIFIGSAKVQLHKVLSQGHDDTTWPLQTKGGRNAGEVRSKLHYSNALKPATSSASSAPHTPPPYAPCASTPSPYSPYSAAYPPPPRAPAAPVYPPQFSYSPQFSYTWYAPNSTGYPPSPYSTSPPADCPPPPYPPTSTYPTPAPATPYAPPAYPDPSPYCSYDPANSTGYPSFPAAYPPPPYP
ncbi:uncharacterized protein LOC132178897 [Corylus avellana]|uniref:uncharacterized protein LOC132178897 n=1 Tax=Corylus avellana TaxID=13451 RepID=UPI001E20D8D0|nr:uncharacterized protein LOC132178897 [Corylus avellana]